MKVIIAGGGTGGHIFPAVALAEQIMNTDENNEVLFIGTKRGMEGKLIPQKGFKIEFIRSYPILGKNIILKLKGMFYIFVGIYESIKIFAKFKPEIVVGVGGYVSGPVVLAAFIKRIPRVICEQNSVPGMTNKVLSYFAHKVFITFEKSKNYFNDQKTVLSGNPIQNKFISVCSDGNNNTKSDEFNVLILGGSQGARNLNELMPKSLSQIAADGQINIKIVHQTGDRQYESVLQSYSKHNLNAQVLKFISNIEGYYLNADLVIARSGAGTLAEICCIGRASVLIPFPYATHNHQYHNARVLEENGAALLIEDKDLDVQMFSGLMLDLLDHNKLSKMAQKAKELGKPDASKVVIENIYELLNLQPCTDV